MSAPSSFHRRASPAAVRRQQRGLLMTSEQLTRQLSSVSSEGYHRKESASVPFIWESQPGTPKVRFPENPLPPLTPPPSYHYTNSNKRTKSKVKEDSSKGNLLQPIFPKRITRKGSAASKPISQSLSCSSSSSSSSFSSSLRPRSHSVPSSPMLYPRKEEEDEDLYDVPVSGFCFGNARSRGCYSSMIKKVLLGDFL